MIYIFQANINSGIVCHAEDIELKVEVLYDKKKYSNNDLLTFTNY